MADEVDKQVEIHSAVLEFSISDSDEVLDQINESREEVIFFYYLSKQ